MQLGEPIFSCSDAMVDFPPRKKKCLLTKDVVVIGWINPEEVSLSTGGVSRGVLKYYPLDGVIDGWLQKRLTAAHLLLLSLGSTIHPVVARPLNAQEKKYILNWMFKHAANREPPSGFADENALRRFADTRTNYKLFNRFRVSFWVYEDTNELTGDPFSWAEEEASIGVTIEPIFRSKVPGEAGPLNARTYVNMSMAGKINDGTPERRAVNALNTLVGSGLRWSHIGSMIKHHLSATPSYEVKVQVYPTYYIYERQAAAAPFRRVRVVPQSPEPSMNFSTNPYPPGPAPFVPSPLLREVQRRMAR